MADETNSTGAMQVDIDLVRQLAAVLDETHLTEIEVEDGERRVRVARTVTVAPAAVQQVAAPAPAAPAPAPAAPAAPAAEAAPSPVNSIRSPMVGTAYLAATPEAPPFVKVGQKVAKGDTLLIIEAMKTMNPILAPAAGIIREVLVQNGQPVEFDQPLIVVE